ncbi:amylo-alpha-1,6-glucosidase [Streptomyces sp. NPDC090106]|uniref:amylo-alpha-1,6-glucosidase n=1 Tax=Streptomyces sp. NPDC090106 TaxID=3365946 RepID=UPI00380523DB
MPHGPSFALSDIPFSTQGSWLSLSPVVAQHRTGDTVHLISHVGGMHPVLALRPFTGDTPAEVRLHATFGTLAMEHTEGSVEAVFQQADVLRLRGHGLSLRIGAAEPELTPFTGTYLISDPLDGSHVFTSYETGRRYRVTVLSGRADVVGAEALGRADRHLTLTPTDPGTTWEVALEELHAARPPYRPPTNWTDTAAKARADFTAYADRHLPWATPGTPAAELAGYVLWSATVDPAGYLTRPAVLMSKHWMNKLWSWDHCFNALALAEGDPRLALDQFLIPFDHQDDSGALPDSVTHSEILYNYVKPPIHGWALSKLRPHIDLTAEELTNLYDRLTRWTDFWLTTRRAPGATLPHYHHGNDSGWDNATTFLTRRVRVSADLSAFLVLQLDELSALAALLDRPEESERHAKDAAEILDALLTGLWDGERFRSRPAGDEEAAAPSDSLLDLMPIVLGERLPQEIADRLADRISTHLTPHGLATEHPDSPYYEADGYWRGPIWAPSTVLIEDGLRRAGHRELADEVSARFRLLCETHGFAENFDALTGQGQRDRAYTWTASGYLLLARAHLRRGTAHPAR